MRKITEILRLKYEAKLSHEKIARALGLSKGAVGKYVSLAKAQGLTWPLPAELDEAGLEARLFRRQAPAARYVEPDYPRLHQELKRKGITLQLLWAEYAETHGDSAYRYTQFCHRYRQWCGRQKRSMRQVHRAGEKLFVDYCGPTVAVVDGRTGEVRPAQVFVAVLGASNYTYAEATWSQGLPDWIASHQRAFRFIGGVPALLVPDNLRAGVHTPCRYAPEPNATYAELARHYGTAILPARPYKPKDKAKAEAGVQLVERWILARLRHHTFFSLAELNQAISELLEDLNRRPFQKLPGSRLSAFESLDKPVLKPLPAQPYDYAEWKKAKPGIDYHIEVDRHFYSVPHALVGQVLDVRMTASLIEKPAGGESSEAGAERLLDLARAHASAAPPASRLVAGTFPQLGQGNRPLHRPSGQSSTPQPASPGTRLSRLLGAAGPCSPLWQSPSGGRLQPGAGDSFAHLPQRQLHPQTRPRSAAARRNRRRRQQCRLASTRQSARLGLLPLIAAQTFAKIDF